MIDPAGNDLTQEEAFIVRMGMLDMWVCAPKSWSKEQVQEFIDLKSSTEDLSSGWLSGTSANWIVQEVLEHEDEHFLSPGFCQEDENRQHWNCHC